MLIAHALCLAALMCLGSGRPAAAMVTRSSPPARADTASSLDTAREARAVFSRCRRGRAKKGECYDSTLVRLARDGQVRTALGVLRTLSVLDPDVKRDGHVHAHAIGIAAGKSGADVSDTFESCTEIFQSGCYHGVIQTYFERAGRPRAGEINAVCAKYTRDGANQWLRFQCVHGIGHGITMYYGHNLPRALEACDLLTQSWDRSTCYGGAFMENVVHATMPHHPASSLTANGGNASDRHAHHGAHPGAASATNGGAAAFKPIDRSDPHYPCSIVAEKYLSNCYAMQTSIILALNGKDMAAAARTCEQAPGEMRMVCHVSLGRDVSAYSSQDHAEATRMCSLAAPRFQPWCFVGVVKNLIDLTAKPEDGFAFCRSLPGGANKLMCYQAVGEQIFALEPTAAGRQALCTASESEYAGACFYGATVSGVRPPELDSIWTAVRQ